MSVARSAFRFAIGTVFSRVSGLVRSQAVLYLLGAGPVNDAFVIAQRIPNLLRDILAEGAMSSSFTKVYTGLKQTDADAAEKLLFQMIYFGFLLSLTLVGLGVLFTPQLVDMMNMMKGSETQTDVFAQNAETMTRILFPCLGTSIVGALAMGALYEKGKFFLNAVIPILANLGVILGGFLFPPVLLKLAPDWAARAGDIHALSLAWGTLLGFVMQMLAALWGVKDILFKGAKAWIAQIPWSGDIWKVLVLLGPAIIASSGGPINAIVNTNFATLVGPGAVSWLETAFRLLQMPIGIFGVAVGVSALPALTRAVVAAGKKVDETVTKQLQNAVQLVTWLLCPCMVYTMANDQTIIRLLFHMGKFQESDVLAVSKAFFAYSISMIAYGWIKVFSSFYYSVDRTTYAMKVSLFGVALNFVANMLLAREFGHVGLALTSSLTLSVNALLLAWGTRSSGVRFDGGFVRKNLFILIIASVTAAALQYLFNLWQPFLPLADIWHGKLMAVLALSVQLGLLLLVFVPAAGPVFGYRVQDLPKRIMGRLRRPSR